MELGMYEPVKAAIDRAESLLKDRQFDAAFDALYKTYRELMRKSGTDERNARRYGKNGPASGGVAMVATADGVEEWGVLGPDQYGGEFLKAVSAGERDLVFAVDAGFFGLRGDLVLAEMNAGGKDLGAEFQKVRAAVIRARPLLEKLGGLSDAAGSIGAGGVPDW